MFRQTQNIFILLCAFFAITRGNAQITANPSFVGCAPYSVVLSGPPGATNIYWNLGQGMGTSTLSSPNPIYVNAGTYNITYTALVNGNPVSYNGQVLVKVGPTGNLNATIPSSHCAPMAVGFSATGPPGSIFTWDFGDLSGLGTGQTIVHTYSAANIYVPLLTILDAVTGCTALATSNTTVIVSAIPKIDINSSNGYSSCTPPHTTHIDGSNSKSGSPLGGGLTFNWNFNAGVPPTATGPVPGLVTFNAPGSHTIAVTVQDNNQCSNTKTVEVTIAAPYVTAIFPTTVCLGARLSGTYTTNQSTISVAMVGTPDFTVFPVVSNTSYTHDPLFELTQPGWDTIVVTTQPPNCVPFVVKYPVFVEKVTANFVWPTLNVTCNPSVAVNFTNTSFINSGSSIQSIWKELPMPENASQLAVANPTGGPGLTNTTFTFSQGSLSPYTIYGLYSPLIELTVISANGCADVIKIAQPVIQRPSANFVKDKRRGCFPLEVQLIDRTVTHMDFPVTSYTWNSGESPPNYSMGIASPTPPAIPTPTFTYANPGVYKPYLIIQTAGGCIDVSFLDEIIVVDPPAVSATYPASVCVGQPFTFNMQGTVNPVPPDHLDIDHWHIHSDNGYFSGCTTDPTPTYSFATPGIHTVVATAYFENCPSSTTLAPTIQVKGAFGKFTYETSCITKTVVNFYVYLEGSPSANLNFGDNQSTTITGNASGSYSTVITHTYNTAGDYTVHLLSTSNTNECGPFSFKHVVNLRDAKANILFKGKPIPPLPDAMACVNDPYAFSGEASTDHTLACSVMYTWFYETKDYTLAPWTVKIAEFATKIVTVQVKPKLLMEFNMVDSLAEDTFRYAGTYTIGLRVKDINGCVDVQKVPFRISQAIPDYTFAANPACLSDGLQVVNFTQSKQQPPDKIKQYYWDFGDFTGVITSTNPTHNPHHQYISTMPPADFFTVVCTATNNVGCAGRTEHTVQINNPVSGFLENVTTTCLKLGAAAQINFTANPGHVTYSVNYGEPPSNPVWQTAPDFTSGINVHVYTTPGVYTPTLIATDPAGCKSEEKREINIVGQPTAAISLPDGKNGFCRPAQPLLTGTNSAFNVQPITNYIWAMGAITMVPPGSKTLQATFTQPATTVTLTVSMTDKLLCPHSVTTQIFTYDPMATAILTPTMFCVGDKIEAGIDIDHDVMMWQWSFGDFVQQPVRYNTPNTPTTVTYPYPVFPSGSDDGKTFATLIYYATTDANNTCRKAESIPIRVIEAKSDFKQSFDVYKHCLKLGDDFKNTSVNFSDLSWSYDWDFGDQTIGNGFTTQHTYLNPGVYPVKMTVRENNYGCKAVSVKEMTVFPLPTATLVVKQSVCPGQPFQIDGSGTPGGSGVLTGTLEPEVNTGPFSFDQNNMFQVNAVITKSTAVTLKVKDDNNCEGSASSVMINAQLPANTVAWDTTIIIGEPVPLNAFAGEGFTYTWTPMVDYLNCETCLIYNPVSTTTTNITYTVAVEDALRCSVVQNTYKINIDLKASLDVPTAFTPNGDGINDIIYPGGWGIKKLVYFRIFNRWGQLLFESNDLSIGWDGVFSSVPQNMETYVYQVSAETYSSQQPVISKTGTFKLLR